MSDLGVLTTLAKILNQGYDWVSGIEDEIISAAELTASEYTDVFSEEIIDTLPERLNVALKSDAITKEINRSYHGDRISSEEYATALRVEADSEFTEQVEETVGFEALAQNFIRNLEREFSDTIWEHIVIYYLQEMSSEINEEVNVGDVSDLANRGDLNEISLLSEHKPSYDSLVGLYTLVHDVTHAQNRTTMERQAAVAEEVIQKEIANSDKEQLKIIDLGCGTGELIKYLENRNEVSEIVGVDNKRGMIRAAKKYTGVESDLILEDIRRLKKPRKGYFDIAFIFRTFTYLYKDKEVNATLNNVSRLLSDQGLLVFDCVNKHKLWEGQEVIPKERDYNIPETVDLTGVDDAPNIKIDYIGRYTGEDFDKGHYIYEANWSMKQTNTGSPNAHASFEITETEYLRAMSRNEIKNHLPTGLSIEGEQPDFQPSDNVIALNFMNYLRKR